MTRYQLRQLKQQHSCGSFYLSTGERATLERDHPKLLRAWDNAEMAYDYAEIALDREISSAPEEWD